MFDVYIYTYVEAVVIRVLLATFRVHIRKYNEFDSREEERFKHN